MKKRIVFLLVCICVLTSALAVTALAAGDAALPTLPEEPTLHLNGVALVPTQEGTTHTFEDGGVVTLTTVGQNTAGGTDRLFRHQRDRRPPCGRHGELHDRQRHGPGPQRRAHPDGRRHPASS